MGLPYEHARRTGRKKRRYGAASTLGKIDWRERAHPKEDGAMVTMILAGLGRGAKKGN